MVIKYINEGAFDSYKNGKLSKEEKRKELRKITGSIIKKEQIKELLPLFKNILSTCIKQKIQSFRKHTSCSVLHFQFDNKVERDDNGFPYYVEDQEYIITPILEIINSDTILVKIPTYFNEYGELIFNVSDVSCEDYKDDFEFSFKRNKELQEKLNDLEIKNVEIKLILTNESYEIHEEFVALSHFSLDKMFVLERFFNQFDAPVIIKTASFKTYYSFGYNDFSVYKQLGKYFKVNSKINVEINDNKLTDIDDIKEIFNEHTSMMNIVLTFKKYYNRSYGPTPDVLPVSEDLLKKYFNITYKEIIENYPATSWGRACIYDSYLYEITFKIDNPFNFKNNIRDVEYICGKR